LQALRQTRRDYRGSIGKATIAAAEAEKSGAMVFEAERITKSFGGPPIIRDFSTRVMRGDRIGIVGPHGTGKTTLVNILVGTSAPDSGEVRRGSNLQMVTLDQGRESLNADWTLAQALAGTNSDTVTVGGSSKHVVGYMRDFLF